MWLPLAARTCDADITPCHKIIYTALNGLGAYGVSIRQPPLRRPRIVGHFIKTLL